MHLVEPLCTDLYTFSKTKRKIEGKIHAGFLIELKNAMRLY